MLDRYALAADYGAYEPTFYSTDKDTFTAQPGKIFNGLTEPNINIDDRSYAVGFGGPGGTDALTPWGLQYNLTSTLDRSAYQSFKSNGVPLVPFTQDQTFSGVTLQQPLLKNLWIDSTRLAIMVAKKNLHYDELGFRFLVMTNISATEQAYFELEYAFENAQVQQEAVDLAAELVSENEKRVKAGVLTELDVAQSQSQLLTAKASLLAADQLITTDEKLPEGI